MQSQVVSGVTPLLLYFCSLSNKKTNPPSPHLSISLSSCFLFALLVCLFIFITSLSFYLPPPLPLTLPSWYFSSLFAELFLVAASSSWQWVRQMQQAAGDLTDVRHWDSVEWNDGILNFFCGLICAYLSELIYPPHVTLDFKCAFKTAVNLFG